jgi:hypothetical protein
MKRFLLLLSVCAIPAMAQDRSADLRAAAGCGPAATEFSVKVDKNQHAVTQPEPGKALVYVIAQESPDDSYNIGDVTTRVGLDGAWVGANYGESYLSFSLAPREHRVCVDWQSSLASRQQLSGAVELTAEAGKTYYFRAWILPSGLGGGPHERLWLKQVDYSAEGLLLLSKAGQSAWKEKK